MEKEKLKELISEHRSRFLDRGNLIKVFLELKRRKKEVYYGRSHKGREVDFILKEGLQVTEAIQVCVSMANEKTLHRELEAMNEACGELEKGRTGDQAGVREYGL